MVQSMKVINASEPSLGSTMTEDELTKMMNDVYVAAIDGLKKLHNG